MIDFVKRSLLVIALSAGLLGIHRVALADEEMEKTTLVKTGDVAPSFALTTLDGAKADDESLKGKVLVLVFFATWCGPCLEELPHIEKEIWQPNKSRDDFALLVVGREHTTEELASFKKDKGYTFAMAADPKREVYAKFATQYIPRVFVLDKDRKVLFATIGNSPESLKNLKKTLDSALPKDKQIAAPEAAQPKQQQ